MNGYEIEIYDMIHFYNVRGCDLISATFFHNYSVFGAISMKKLVYFIDLPNFSANCVELCDLD